MIENTAKQTQEQAMALANALGTKIDFYEYQNLQRPPYYAQGFVACGSPIPNGCCN